jgi:hypothetical protein
MKTKLYLHIGQNKTGTSFIQNFLDINREKLYKEYQYLYPNLNSENFASGRCHNHAQWFINAKNKKNVFFQDLEKLFLFADNKSIKAIILSSEGWLLDDSAVNLYKIAKAKNIFSDITLICYLRRIDHWLESAWKQWGIKTHENFNDYYNQAKFHNQFETIFNKLNCWEKVVGKENIILRPYEKDQLKNGLLEDFMKCIELIYDLNEWNETEKTNIATNYSFDRDVLEILHMCRTLYSGKHDNRYFDLFSSLLDNNYLKQPFESQKIMSPSQRYNIICNNLPFEKLIARKFLRRNSGKVFYEPIPDPLADWEAYVSISLEKVVPILVNLIYKNNQIIEENKKLYILNQSNKNPKENISIMIVNYLWKKLIKPIANLIKFPSNNIK